MKKKDAYVCNKNLVIFGTGNFCRKRLTCFKNEHIIAFADNNEKLWGSRINGIEVVSPNNLILYDDFSVCLMVGAKFCNEIKKQLNDLGIKENIFTFREYFESKEVKDVTILQKHRITDKELLIFMPSLYNSGGIRAGIYALVALKEIVTGITVISPCEGETIEELTSSDINIIISPDMSCKNSILWSYVTKCRYLILNGLYCAYIISQLKGIREKNAIWWIHTGDSFYEVYPVKSKDIETRDVQVYGVSNLVYNAYKRHFPSRKMEIMPYGIPDASSDIRLSHSKIIFAVIGAVSWIKGIDILIDAIKLLSKDEKDESEFWIIGEDLEKEYSMGLRAETNEMECVKWFGKKSNEEVLQLYRYIDVLISSSREDMLPIVTIEAFMKSRPCILSENVGTVGFIEDGKEAYVYKNNSPENLAECIKRMIASGMRQIDKMGKSGRKVYEKYFTIDALRMNLMKALEIQ